MLNEGRAQDKAEIRRKDGTQATFHEKYSLEVSSISVRRRENRYPEAVEAQIAHLNGSLSLSQRIRLVCHRLNNAREIVSLAHAFKL